MLGLGRNGTGFRFYAFCVCVILAAHALTACAAEIKTAPLEPTEIVHESSVPDLPRDFSTWTRYTDFQYTFSIPHPPTWQRTPLQENNTLTAIAFSPPPPTDVSVTVQVIALETLALHPEVNAHPFRSIPGNGLLQQGRRFRSQMLTQKLTGESSSVQNGRARTHTALFKQHGKGYIIRLRYLTDGAVNQNALTIYEAMVEGFRLRD